MCFVEKFGKLDVLKIKIYEYMLCNCCICVWLNNVLMLYKMCCICWKENWKIDVYNCFGVSWFYKIGLILYEFYINW